MSSEPYDVVCIGGGPGGSAAAQQAARHGLRVCLVERAEVGGACLNRGCMPTKAMLASSEAFWSMRNPHDLAVDGCDPGLDGPRVMRRVHGIVRKLRETTEQKLDGIDNLERLAGQGRLKDPRTVLVETDAGDRELPAKHIVIATGARPRRPSSIPDLPQVMTSDDAVAMTELPGSVVVVGAGPIGCEFSTFFAEMGAKVVLVEKVERCLSQMDAEACSTVQDLMDRRGVEMLLGVGMEDVTESGDRVKVRLDNARTFDADRVLLALGRRANVEDLGLEAAGVDVEDGIIPVDACCRTNVEGVYAVGDCAEKRQYAHLAERMGAVAGEQIAGRDLRDDRTVVPFAAYTHPEIAAVGLTESEARRRYGARVHVGRYCYSDSGTATLYGLDLGRVKVVADEQTGQLYGAIWAGPRGTDMIHEIALAMRYGLGLEEIWRTIHAHPSFQEALHALAEEWTTAHDKGGRSRCFWRR